jgi:2',3'-cyclic-nucleotide 2'-phosphodiesterase (5'-nucleotidase family)
MMRQLLIVLSLALSLACSRKEETTFVILHTTDLHGVLGSEMSALAVISTNNGKHTEAV